MALTKRWETSADWLGWVNEDSTRRSPRVISGLLKLPFVRVKHIGTGNLVSSGSNDELIARWSFGQRRDLNCDLNADDDNLELTTVNINHAVTRLSGVPVSLSEDGMNSTTRNGYLTVDEKNDFDYPDSPDLLYISCWIKSHIINYSDGPALIAGYYDTFNDRVAYGLMVDNDGLLKAIYRVGSATATMSPSGGEVYIDTDWHHLFFALGREGASSFQLGVFIVDNDWDETFSSIQPTGLGTGQKFTIGSAENDTSLGFSGIVDELVVSKWNVGDINSFAYADNHRFETEICLSPVVDTGRNNSLLATVYAQFEVVNDTSVQFSFRASDTIFTQLSTTIEWTGFTTANQIRNDAIINTSEIGVYVRGRYQQVRIRIKPSDSFSPTADPRQMETPVLNVLEISAGVSNKLLVPSDHAYEPGIIRGQVVNFSGSMTIDKATLNLSITDTDKTDLVQGSNGVISFQAANFQESRNAWKLQPILHWSNGWDSSGTTIQNTFQNISYDSLDDALLNASYLKYNLLFPNGGTYDLWGYGNIEGNGMWWGFSDDDSDLRRFTLGDNDSGWQGVPKWTKFGTVFLEEGGSFSFTVYLGELNTAILDQWYFTTNINFVAELDQLGNAGYSTPLPLSKAPFNTALRLRSLYNNDVDDIEGPRASLVRSITAWLPSRTIRASGKFNYEIIENDEYGITGMTFVNGLSMEYWQIGGSSDYFASWDYSFPATSIGSAFRSIDAGQNYA